MIARQTVRRVVEKLLRLTGANPARMAGRSLILAYHNVVPDEHRGLGDSSLHLPWTTFLRQMDLLQTHCRVCSLAEILAQAPFRDGPCAAITFDDAYRGAVELALPELARRGLPCTLFVAPGLLACRSFWWDELGSGGPGLTERVRQIALEDDAGRHEQVRARVGEAAATADTLPSSYGCASEAQLRALDAPGNVTFGAHSWSHPNLARIKGDELVAELSRPLEWLNSSGLRTAPLLAYPYGLTSPAVERAVSEAGYTAALLVQGGWLPAGSKRPWAIPRYNVPAGLSDDGLMLRLSGLLST